MTAERSGAPGLLAGIVAFLPNPASLLGLVDRIAPDVARVAVFCNSEIDPALRADLMARPQVDLIDAGTNLGIGTGLNLIALHAALAGFESIVLFDQDSKPPPGMIERLRDAEAVLLSAGHDPAVVAPRMVAADPAASKAPTYRLRPLAAEGGRLREAEFVPTSGSLLRLAVLRRIGFFRADFFIDGIDLEWSFRARAHGLSCWVAWDCPMVHTVGNGVIAWPLIGLSMPLQRPFRMHCTVRNTLYGLRLPHIPRSWKARQIAYLHVQMLAYALHHRFSPGVLRALGTGLIDGLSGRLGIPSGAPDGRSPPS